MAENVRKQIENQVSKDEVKKLMIRLLQKPSFQTDLFESDPMIIDFIKNDVYGELKDSGVKSITLDPMSNLIVKIKSNRGGPSLMLLSYAMTPAPGAMKDPFSGKVVPGEQYGLRGECILGRGACEQKGTLAAMMTTAEILNNLDEEPAGDIVFVVSTAGETGRHDSLKQVIEKDGIKTDQGVQSGEPDIQLGNKGRLDVIVNVEGKASHSSVPWEGINAIEGAFKVYGKLGKLMPNPTEKSHPVLGKSTFTPIYIESFPRATHTVQARCDMRFDRRLLPGESPEFALNQVRDAVGSVDPFRVSVQGGPFMYPSEVAKDSAVALRLSKAISALLGKEPKYCYSHQALDAGYMNVMGIQTICYGSGQYRFAHTDIDMSSVEDTVDVAKSLAYMALT